MFMFKCYYSEISIRTSATKDLILKTIWQILSVENNLTDFNAMTEHSIKQGTLFPLITYSSLSHTLMCVFD